MGEMGERLNMYIHNKTSAISRYVGALKHINRLLKMRVCGPGEEIRLFPYH